MSRLPPQWTQGGTYAGADDRRLIGALYPTAHADGCQVGLTGSGGMDVAVQPGSVAVPSANQTGSLLCTSTAVETVPIETSPAAGNERLDLIVCQAHAADLDGAAADEFIFQAVKGAESLPPAALPATPANAVALARVKVAGGVAAIVAADIADLRPPSLAVPEAVILPPPTTSATTVSFTDTRGEVWVAKAGVYGGAWKRARDVLQCSYYRNAAFTVATGSPQVIYMDTAESDPYGLYTSNGFVPPLAGKWRIDVAISAQPTASGQWLQAGIQINGTLRSLGGAHGSTAVWTTAHADVTLPFLTHDVVKFTQGASAAMTGVGGPSNRPTHCSIAYYGTG